MSCSTPFGINERITSPSHSRPKPPFTCSTPFGINERITNNATIREHWERSAQRLSASTKESLAGFANLRGAYGVLNAFRHQRKNHLRLGIIRVRKLLCSTPFGINERITCQRQTVETCPACAQRLSASTKESPPSPVCRLVIHVVLNAFRHQRKNHFSPTRQGTTDVRCSTPFGINERITRDW